MKRNTKTILVFGGIAILGVLAISNVQNTAMYENTTATSTQQTRDTRTLYEKSIEKQKETIDKNLATLEKLDTELKALDALQVEAERQYKKTTDDYNAKVKEKNELVEALQLTSPATINIYSNAINDSQI